jgi:hypothetical protein
MHRSEMSPVSIGDPLPHSGWPAGCVPSVAASVPGDPQVPRFRLAFARLEQAGSAWAGTREDGPAWLTTTSDPS